jgi:hypothetical protein
LHFRGAYVPGKAVLACFDPWWPGLILAVAYFAERDDPSRSNQAGPKPVPKRYHFMKGVFAAIIAIVILWIADAHFNGGRYTLAAVRMARPMLAHLGIHI